MKTVKLSLAFLLLAINFHTAPAQNWRKVDGSSGVISVAVNPKNKNTIWFGGDGGIYISYNGGVSIGRVISQDAKAILIHPVDTTLIFVGSFGGLRRSTDNGNTWTTAVSGISYNGEAIAVEPNHPDTVYSGAFGNTTNPDNVFFRSTNRGQTWTAIPIPGAGGFCAVAAGGNGLLIGGSINKSGVIWRSTDYCSTWTSVYTSSIPNIFESPKITFEKVNPTTVWAALWGATQGYLAKSIDAGATWQELPQPQGSNPWAIETDIYGRVFVGMLYGSPPGATMTSDSGATWRALSTGNPPFQGGGDVWMIKSNGDTTGVFLADAMQGAYKLVDTTSVPVSFFIAPLSLASKSDYTTADID